MGLPCHHSLYHMHTERPVLEKVDSMLQKLLIGISNSLKLPPFCNWNSPTNTTVLQFTATLAARALRTRIRSPEDLPSRDATRNLSLTFLCMGRELLVRVLYNYIKGFIAKEKRACNSISISCMYTHQTSYQRRWIYYIQHRGNT